MAGKVSILRNAVSLALLLIFTSVLAYVPALPTNSSQEAIAGGLNVTDISKLHLRWFSNGYYSQNVSYQLVGQESQGISKGVLVHFSEVNVNNATPPTTTPWIAMVSCDFNATDASQEEDVFTLARDKGAVAALLYSLYSLACVINREYADPATFDQVFDIFSTQSYTSAQLIEYQFGQSGPANESIYRQYDSKRLNDSAAVVNTAIMQGSPTSPGYILGILQAYNASGQVDEPAGNTGSTDGTNTPKRSQNTALAMIILYAITGCVSALFIVVIITGAIRAIRHPERYGPRSRNGGGGPGQSRARGLTRAILDTFPIVKFGGNSTQVVNTNAPDTRKDVEARSDGSSGSGMELHEWEIVDGTHDGQDHPVQPGATGADAAQDVPLDADQNTGTSSTFKLAPVEVRQPVSATAGSSYRFLDPGPSTSQRLSPAEEGHNDVVPESMGRETCPICIMDFEEGDDLRLLPCEGKHRFHQSCVDPWLLELSSSCPICREDFLALENILSGESEQGHQDYDPSGDYRRTTRPDSPSGSGNRFSRYLRFAKRRHHRNRTEDEHDPTDPYMPTAPDTSIYPTSGQSSPP
ncbi:hypothetical protein Hypma_007906 [Hypsizygus marmoreus]|uniref:RING-type domain-containing protein n=1 Tax=Hypsizygus marmoreus TaxID=39966 RepID=A0A369JS26_HYPMA|nr:hypothetical protein Hypma_007906 [Hypsizygus marmoreus]